MNACQHPWTVTAPWYAWSLAGVPRAGRGTAPLIQKFASDDFVNQFIKDPQHSLVFDDDIDQAYTAQLVQAQPGQFADKIAALFPSKADGTPFNTGDAISNLRKSRLVGTGVRKLYLPSHARHYLVVCELHCDEPGLPAPARGSVCQAGFVVRRRRVGYTPEQHPQALTLLRQLVQAQAALADLAQATPLRAGLAQARASRIARLQSQGRFDDALATATHAVQGARTELQAWQTQHGVRCFKEAWVADAADPAFGAWREIEDETPALLEESWIRLTPLIADPRNATHSARGRALFYGVVPTAAFETGVDGEARFDERCTYEIRSVFRQHDCRCPFAGLNADAPDCGGALVWSEPTEPYRIAAQFDLLGSANRPVTIQMPDLSELAAQAAARPLGQFSPVRMVHKQQLSSKTDGSIPTSGSIGGPAICFFSIPLITIVASFVLNLFLPIVVLIFNLWFLLALRFCIPPSFSVEAGLQLELAAIPPKLDVDAEFEVDVDAAGWSWNGQSGADVRTALADEVAGTLSETTGVAKSKVKTQLLNYSVAPLISLGSVMAEKAQLKPQADGSVKAALDLSRGRVWRTPRISQWMHEKHLPTTGEFA